MKMKLDYGGSTLNIKNYNLNQNFQATVVL